MAFLVSENMGSLWTPLESPAIVNITQVQLRFHRVSHVTLADTGSHV